ncbi:MAG: hypothetical protein K2P81_01430 [Bacteriovoracaceae bacterium]|nr:hypothetical protein [Bacteriovoracaceae bacterium]
MKNFIFTTLMLLSTASFAQTSSLFVKDGRKLIDVEKLIAQETDVQATYGYENFCYKGEVDAVVKKMKVWKKTDFFFGGGGGGFAIRTLKVIRGIVTYDIAMGLEDEVVPEDGLRQVIIKPCR